MASFPEIPDYRIEKKFGRGAMGTVYLAFQEKLERLVALKVLLPSLAEEKEITQRFIAEAKIGAHLQHSNIVSIFDVGEYQGIYYFAMEYLEISLKDFIRANKDGILKPEIALDITKQIGSALDYAHRHGVIHRDVKPANILLRNDGTPVLVDFGIAKLMDSGSRLTRTGTSVGTPHYMSPEQIQGLDTDGRADLYSLGVVFYEMLEGRPPYEGSDPVAIAVKHIREPVPRLNEAFKPYQPVLEKMMAKDRRDRFQTGRALVDAIQNLQLGSLTPEEPEKEEHTVIRRQTDRWPEIIPATESPLATDKAPPRPKRVRAWIMVLLAPLLAGLGLYLVIQSRSNPERKLWLASTRSHTIDAYESYINRYPKGIYLKRAENALSELKKPAVIKPEPNLGIEAIETEKRYLELIELSRQFLADQDYQNALDVLGLARKIRNSEELDQLEKEIKTAETASAPRFRLRAKPREIDIGTVQAMLKRYGFFDTHKNKVKGFQNQLNLKTRGGEKVVLDRATGLMWHQRGSAHYMNLSGASTWINSLNRNRYAGFSDWRLPTLEEAASLLESGKHSTGLHIHPIFNATPRSIWTCDTLGQEVWIVYYDHGYADINWPQFNSYVRPVRTGL